MGPDFQPITGIGPYAERPGTIPERVCGTVALNRRNDRLFVACSRSGMSRTQAAASPSRRRPDSPVTERSEWISILDAYTGVRLHRLDIPLFGAFALYEPRVWRETVSDVYLVSSTTASQNSSIDGEDDECADHEDSASEDVGDDGRRGRAKGDEPTLLVGRFFAREHLVIVDTGKNFRLPSAVILATDEQNNELELQPQVVCSTAAATLSSAVEYLYTAAMVWNDNGEERGQSVVKLSMSGDFVCNLVNDFTSMQTIPVDVDLEGRELPYMIQFQLCALPTGVAVVDDCHRLHLFQE